MSGNCALCEKLCTLCGKNQLTAKYAEKIHAEDEKNFVYLFDCFVPFV